MEELINYCESEAACLDMLCGEQYSAISHSGYTSVIKFDGWPILPPVVGILLVYFCMHALLNLISGRVGSILDLYYCFF